MNMNYVGKITVGLLFVICFSVGNSVFAIDTEQVKTETTSWATKHIIAPIDTWRARQAVIWELMIESREKPEPVKIVTDVIKKNITDKALPVENPETQSIIDSFDPEKTINIAYTYLLQVLVWIIKTTVVFYTLATIMGLLVIKKLFSILTASSE